MISRNHQRSVLTVWRFRWLSPALALAMVMALLFTAPVQAQQEASLVAVDTVKQEPLSQTVPVIGRLVSLQSGVVASRTAGLVEQIQVQVGDHVEQGDTIAVLDQDRLRAAIALRQTELQEFQAQRETEAANVQLAQQQLERLEKLRGTAAFNQSLYDTRVQELAVARSSRQEMEARIARGRIALLLAETELTYGIIEAPFPGTVTLRNTNQGAWVKIGDPVVNLLNDVDLEIEADVPANRLDGLEPGSLVTVLLDDGTRHQARVRAIIPDENPTTRTRPVRFIPEFGKTQLALAINQPVTLALPAGSESRVVSVHKDAVLHRGGETLVFVVEDGTARSRSVILGEAVGSRFQVLEGLQPGDVVVVRGNERLRPGQKVRYPGQPDVALHAESSPRP